MAYFALNKSLLWTYNLELDSPVPISFESTSTFIQPLYFFTNIPYREENNNDCKSLVAWDIFSFDCGSLYDLIDIWEYKKEPKNTK